MKVDTCALRVRVAIAALLSLAPGGIAHPNDQNKVLQNSEAHDERVMGMIPPHSALPPILDLSKHASTSPGASRKWEYFYRYGVGGEEVLDPGLKIDKGSVSMTIMESIGRVWALPVNCEAIMLAKTLSASAHISFNKRLVYSTYDLKISEVLKGDRKSGISSGATVTAAQLGGTVRFPSGHVSTFLEQQEGFLKPDTNYFLFLWRPQPIRRESTYVIAEAYVIEGDLVFPVDEGADVSAYTNGMPLTQFRARIQSAILKNESTN